MCWPEWVILFVRYPDFMTIGGSGSSEGLVCCHGAVDVPTTHKYSLDPVWQQNTFVISEVPHIFAVMRRL